jgi:hypothetical protein
MASTFGSQLTESGTLLEAQQSSYLHYTQETSFHDVDNSDGWTQIHSQRSSHHSLGGRRNCSSDDIDDHSSDYMTNQSPGDGGIRSLLTDVSTTQSLNSFTYQHLNLKKNHSLDCVRNQTLVIEADQFAGDAFNQSFDFNMMSSQSCAADQLLDSIAGHSLEYARNQSFLANTNQSQGGASWVPSLDSVMNDSLPLEFIDYPLDVEAQNIYEF